MHAEAPALHPYGDDSWGRPIALAVVVHLLVLAVFLAAWLWSPRRNVEAAAGSPAIEASLDVSASDASAARQALRQTPEPPLPLPDPVPVQEPVPAPEDTVPPPQPIPEPRPQTAQTQQQAQAQERVAQPDTTDQDRVSAMAIAKEKALKEQEEKRRQQQIDLTERERQKQAEQQQRLARQQEEADRQKKLAEQQAQADADKRKRLEQIRKQRAQLDREANLAEQKLKQLQNAASRSTAAAASSSAQSAAAQPAPGQGGTSNDLSARYAAAIQQAVLNQWVRPDSVPRGQKCSINIRQLPGGEVVDVQVGAGCPFDDAGRRSVEAAVLRAQPLPYRGFESVFQRNLKFNFTAQDR